MDDSQFALPGVVPGDAEGAVRQVALRMSAAAKEDPVFRQQLAGLAESRGGIYATAMMNLNDPAPPEREPAAVAS